MTEQPYPGSKTNSGIFQFLCNHTPHHKRYFELFAGRATYYSKKRPAEFSYLAEINPKQVAWLQAKFKDLVPVYEGSALDILDTWPFETTDFVYLDPPYPAGARRSGNKLYTFEMLEDELHQPLLQAIKECPANVMISTSPNELYQLELKDWHVRDFNTMGHRGPRVERIYMNYDPDKVILHQYDMLGKDYMERQAIGRKVDRIAAKLQALPLHQKHLFFQEMCKNDPAAVQHFLSIKYNLKRLENSTKRA